jgi:hypothetical protein
MNASWDFALDFEILFKPVMLDHISKRLILIDLRWDVSLEIRLKLIFFFIHKSPFSNSLFFHWPNHQESTTSRFKM